MFKKIIFLMVLVVPFTYGKKFPFVFLEVGEDCTQSLFVPLEKSDRQGGYSIASFEGDTPQQAFEAWLDIQLRELMELAEQQKRDIQVDVALSEQEKADQLGIVDTQAAAGKKFVEEIKITIKDFMHEIKSSEETLSIVLISAQKAALVKNLYKPYAIEFNLDIDSARKAITEWQAGASYSLPFDDFLKSLAFFGSAAERTLDKLPVHLQELEQFLRDIQPLKPAVEKLCGEKGNESALAVRIKECLL